MPRMSKKRKHELSFYLNDRGRVTWRIMPEMQAWVQAELRAVVVDCPVIYPKSKEKEEHTE